MYQKFCVVICHRFWTIKKIRQWESRICPPPPPLPTSGRVLKSIEHQKEADVLPKLKKTVRNAISAIPPQLGSLKSTKSSPEQGTWPKKRMPRTSAPSMCDVPIHFVNKFPWDWLSFCEVRNSLHGILRQLHTKRTRCTFWTPCIFRKDVLSQITMQAKASKGEPWTLNLELWKTRQTVFLLVPLRLNNSAAMIHQLSKWQPILRNR